MDIINVAKATENINASKTVNGITPFLRERADPPLSDSAYCIFIIQDSDKLFPHFSEHTFQFSEKVLIMRMIFFLI